MKHIVSLLALAVCTPVLAQPVDLGAEPTPVVEAQVLKGRWRLGFRTASFRLVPTEDGGSWVGVVVSPRQRALHDLELSRAAETWTLRVTPRQATSTPGLTGALGQDPTREPAPQGIAPDPAVFALKRKGSKLCSRGQTWRIDLPEGFDEQPPAEVAPVASAARPVVRVLITGFDRFPRPKNHPRWAMDGRDPEARQPAINPAGWVVRQFQLSDVCPELRGEVDIELHKCLDVPVTYVNGARLITDTIERVDADVVISFGVGADSGADADVETSCTNVMDDDDAFSDLVGPFQLPADWPPQTPRSEWSQEDRAWLMRYPDNAGVSYNGAPIDPDGPETLTSLLPVQRIVQRVQSESLRSVDGGWGPGRYICNNVMYRVIQTQADRGRIGGFIHLNSWSESRQEKYLKVVACAVEESVRAFVEAQRQDGLAPPVRE